VIVDRTAPALLLLEENAASAYTPNGKDLWKRDGRFGLGAMSGGGTLALLRPADPGRLDQVHVCRKKRDSDREVEVDVVALPWPVRSLRIAPDGRSALVLGAEGRYALLDLETLRASGEERLSFPESVWISDADFVGDGTLVFGVLLSSEPYPKPDWTKAAVVAVTREGKRIFEQELILREAYAGVPSVEVADGGNAFAAYTRENVIYVELKS
jgi:hypothetical protein